MSEALFCLPQNECTDKKKSQMYYQYISSFGDMSNYQLLHVDVFKPRPTKTQN